MTPPRETDRTLGPFLASGVPPGFDLTLSISKLEDFELCRVKFHKKHVQRLRTPDSPSAALGSDVHTAAEWYLESPDPVAVAGIVGGAPEKRPTPIGSAIFAAGRGLNPPPGSVVVEDWCYIPAFGRPDAYTLLRGRIDYHAPTIPADHLDPRVILEARALGLDAATLPLIGDHKTSGSSRYFKTSIELTSNRQLAVYVRAKYPDAPAAIVEHLQYTTKGVPTAQRTRAILTQAAALNVERKARDLAAEAVRWSASHWTPPEEGDNGLSPADARTDACGAFGGCPFAKGCRFSPSYGGATAIPSFTRSTQKTAPTGATGDDMQTAAQKRAAAMLGASPPDAQTPIGGAAAPPPTTPAPPSNASPATGGQDPNAIAKDRIEAMLSSTGEVGAVPLGLVEKTISRIPGANAATVLGWFLVADGRVSAKPAASAPAAPSGLGPQADALIAMGWDVQDWTLSPTKPDWRVYDAQNNAVVTGLGSEVSAWVGAVAKAVATGVLPAASATPPTPAAPPAPAEPPAPTPAAPAVAVEVNTAAPPPGTGLYYFDAHPAYAAAEDKIRGGVVAVFRALADSEHGTITEDAFVAAVKKGTGNDRLRAPTRNAVVTLATTIGAWAVGDGGQGAKEVEEGGSAPVDGALDHVEPPAAAKTEADPYIAGMRDRDAAVEAARVEATATAIAAHNAAKEPVRTTEATGARRPNEAEIADLVLCIGCHPSGSRPIADFAAWLVDAEAYVAEKAGVATPYLMDFGKGPHSVAAEVLVRAAAGDLPFGWYFLAVDHPAAAAVAGVLARFAGVVIVRAGGR